MEHKAVQSGSGVTGRIEKKVHDVSNLRERADDYDSLSKKEKHQLAQQVEPTEHETVYNVTTDRFHEYFVDNLDPGQSAAKDNQTVDWMALGTDAASGTSTTDTDLNTRVYSETITDHADNGKDLLCSTFVDSTEANGNTLDEIGLYTGDPANLANADVFLLNHATFSAVTKDNSKTVTFDVTLSFSDV